MARLILFNKPYGVLSQFTDSDGHPGLGHHIKEKKVYPAGRLDHDSEGLLLLTDNGQLQGRITEPKFKLPKTYWAQVEGETTEQQLEVLRSGVSLKDGLTRPAIADKIPEPALWSRNPPVRFRKTIPTSWLALTITEGKNRQVRRMTAAVGLPTLRLIRVQIGEWHIGSLQPGEFIVEQIPLPTHNTRPRKKAKNRNHA